MNIDHIESFLYVIEYKSIHKAAQALFLTQPTISARIKALENSLGTQLFIRKGRSLILTEQGQSFIPYAQKIVDTYRKSQLHMQTSTQYSNN